MSPPVTVDSPYALPTDLDASDDGMQYQCGDYVYTWHACGEYRLTPHAHLLAQHEDTF